MRQQLNGKAGASKTLKAWVRFPPSAPNNMTSIADYFAKHRPQPVWHIGDRVFGKWNKIPFIGTVGNDNMISEIEGPRVSVFLDLPIKYDDKVYNIIFVKQNDIKFLKEY